MLNLQPAINDQKKFSNIELKEISPIRKLIFQQAMENHYGKNVWKRAKNIILLLTEQKQCTY